MAKFLTFLRTATVRSTIILAFLLMVFGAVAAVAMTPRLKVADHRNYDLENIIPHSFGDWREDDPRQLVLPDPSANALSDKIYNKVLARTYRGPGGARVMLMIAYGGDQSDQLQLHRPEVCYAANGFRVSPLRFDRREIAGKTLLFSRLDTVDHYGHENVSYWMRVGDREVSTTMDRQWVKLLAGLHGIVPDGVLVRVSTRSGGGDPDEQYAIHDRFVAEMLAHVDGNALGLLVGRGVSAGAGSSAS